MQAAKSDLDNAMKSLRNASADKGGHCERAIGLVREAARLMPASSMTAHIDL